MKCNGRNSIKTKDEIYHRFGDIWCETYYDKLDEDGKNLIMIDLMLRLNIPYYTSPTFQTHYKYLKILEKLKNIYKNE